MFINIVRNVVVIDNYECSKKTKQLVWSVRKEIPDWKTPVLI